jgi:transposase
MASESGEFRYGGIDTHKDIHVVAVIDGVGRLIATASFDTTVKGYGELHSWRVANGSIRVVGIKGTGSYGAGIAALLTGHGVAVVEVNRPDRQLRRRHGKSDTIDAEAAARSALNGQASSIAKTHDEIVESIRLTLTTLRRSRTAAFNTLRSVLITALAALRDELEPLTATARFARCARLRVDSTPSADPGHAAKQALRILARQIAAVDTELNKLRVGLTQLAESANPELMAARGIGVDSASALLITAGDNPERMRSESAFDSLCGASPIKASSGRTVRHRLNRGGDRQANSALWRIAMIRLNTDPRTQAYAARRRADGKTEREILRCLKRHIAREIYRLLTRPRPIIGVHDLRPARLQLRLPMQAAADQLGESLTTISRTERGIRPSHQFAATYRGLAQRQGPRPSRLTPIGASKAGADPSGNFEVKCAHAFVEATKGPKGRRLQLHLSQLRDAVGVAASARTRSRPACFAA